jgi:hypothetical protein
MAGRDGHEDGGEAFCRREVVEDMSQLLDHMPGQRVMQIEGELYIPARTIEEASSQAWLDGWYTLKELNQGF